MLLFNLPGFSAAADGRGERIFWACYLTYCINMLFGKQSADMERAGAESGLAA